MSLKDTISNLCYDYTATAKALEEAKRKLADLDSKKATLEKMLTEFVEKHGPVRDSENVYYLVETSPGVKTLAVMAVRDTWDFDKD
jgi:hypothetical protein